jgi:hypothetical protein
MVFFAAIYGFLLLLTWPRWRNVHHLINSPEAHSGSKTGTRVQNMVALVKEPTRHTNSEMSAPAPEPAVVEELRRKVEEAERLPKLQALSETLTERAKNLRIAHS